MTMPKPATKNIKTFAILTDCGIITYGKDGKGDL